MKDTLTCICSVFWSGGKYVFEVRGEVMSTHKNRKNALIAMEACHKENGIVVLIPILTQMARGLGKEQMRLIVS